MVGDVSSIELSDTAVAKHVALSQCRLWHISLTTLLNELFVMDVIYPTDRCFKHLLHRGCKNLGGKPGDLDRFTKGNPGRFTSATANISPRYDRHR